MIPSKAGFIAIINIILSCDLQLVQHVLDGEGVGWLKLNRLKKLMEDESYRNMVLSKLNRNYNRKTTPSDKVDDVVRKTFNKYYCYI